MLVLQPDALNVLLEETRQQNIPVNVRKRMTNTTEVEDGVEVTFADGTNLQFYFLAVTVFSLLSARYLLTQQQSMFTILPTSRSSAGDEEILPSLRTTRSAKVKRPFVRQSLHCIL